MEAYSDQEALCEAIGELIPAYSFGAADADERAFVEANLARCPDALAALADYTAVKTALYTSAPPVQPPSELETRLMTAIKADVLPTLPITTPAQRVSTRRTRRPAWQYLMSAAVIILIASNAFWFWQWQRTRSSDLTTSTNEQTQFLALVGAGRAKQVWLDAVNNPGNAPGSNPAATLTCDPKSKVALLYVKNFPALPPGKIYQLWMRQNGNPVNVSIFKVDEAGSVTIIVMAPETINNFDFAGITVEPAGGSPKPTGQAIVRGSLGY